MLLLRDKDRQRLLAIAAEYLPNVELWAYGSRLTDFCHDTSDLDVVLRGPNLQAIPLHSLSCFRDAISSSSIPILIDVRDWTRLPKSFQDEILKDYEVLR
jgi:uncharacterized protein